jgi:acid phosphatase (class A)
MKRVCAFAASLFLMASSLYAEDTSASALKRTPYYVDPMRKDLSTILPLPPTQDSETTERELAYVHTIEQTLTPQQVAQAQLDDKEEDLFIFSGVIGPKFTKADLPLTAAPVSART